MNYFYLEKESDEPYDWHKQIWRYFRKYEDRRFLFASGGGELLVLSERPPEGVESSRFILNNGRFSISTVACPVVRNNQSRKLSPVCDDECLDLWIRRQLNGFVVENATHEILKPLSFTKNGKRGIAHRVLFNIDVVVDDIHDARRTVEKGIGKHKFVGCGALIFPGLML